MEYSLPSPSCSQSTSQSQMFPCKSASVHTKICIEECLLTPHRCSAAVSVPFHQIMRSTCPIFTLAIYRVWFTRSYSSATYLSIVPIMFGVALATYGDYYFTITGFWLTLLGVLLASLKVSFDNQEQRLPHDCAPNQADVSTPDCCIQSTHDRDFGFAST